MNWNDLKVFLAVADNGSLAGAATTLNHNHSTIFRRLNTLEDDLNVRLFDRLPTGYVLTPVGERMLELAREAQQAIESVERELAGQDLMPSGTVRLTTAPNIARTIVPIALLALRQSHPEIIVETAVGDSNYDLNRREADIALRATTKPPEHLIGQKVLTIEWWVCGAIDEFNQDSVQSPGLTHVPFVGADQALMRLDAMQWLEARYGKQIVARANDLSAMAAMASAGIGLALLPSDQREPGLHRLFKVPEIGGELWLLTHPDLHKVRRIKAVWEALAEATKNMPPPL